MTRKKNVPNNSAASGIETPIANRPYKHTSSEQLRNYFPNKKYFTKSLLHSVIHPNAAKRTDQIAVRSISGY